MPPLWGYRLVAFIPSLAFAVVSPLVLPSFPLVPLVNGGMVSHLLASPAFPFRLSPDLVIRPIGLTVPIRLIPHTLPYPYLSATLSPSIQGLSYTYGHLSSELSTTPSRV